jgi:flavorubredoxin
MKPRKIREGVFWMGAVDWERRLFDALIPLPDGTSYNAYLVQGSEKTALLDTVDPSKAEDLLEQLKNMPRIDYIIAHHAEQDHSGSLPLVLEKYPGARVLATAKGVGMLRDHLLIPEERFQVVEDGQALSLGGKTLRFLHTPWVHWPETMSSYLVEEKILFSCDFFGSHLATTDLYADEARVYEPAKRYFAEIMMPFRAQIQKNLEKVEALELSLIAPSHGPVYAKPKFILSAYKDWVSSEPRSRVIVPYISMHGSLQAMVDRLVGALVDRGVQAEPYDLSVTDIGRLATAMVDAATVVFGTPAVLGGAHPHVVTAAYLADALRPKALFASLIGSYGWGAKLVEQVQGLVSHLKLEFLNPVLCKGYPKEEDFKALDALAETIARKHRERNLS